MINDYYAIICAYESAPGLGALISHRTSASMPFAGRYRLIDFPLSSLVNAGVNSVGVIMQRDYQSLLDHLGSGKDWDLSRRDGGLKLLPPFGLPESHFGEYRGSMEALAALRTHIDGIKKSQIIIGRGDVAANIDLQEIMRAHSKSGKPLTAVCSRTPSKEKHHRFIPSEAGGSSSREVLCSYTGADGPGLPSLEMYLIEKGLLQDMISHCAMGNLLHFHRDALTWYFQNGGEINLCVHEGYARQLNTVKDYFDASMDILRLDVREQLFPADRPIRTKERADSSTYYSDSAVARNCLVADGCYIEGRLENCVLFRGVRVEKGAELKNCIIMQDTVIKQGTSLAYTVSDKNAVVTENNFMAGSPRLPLVIPKASVI